MVIPVRIIRVPDVKDSKFERTARTRASASFFCLARTRASCFLRGSISSAPKYICCSSYAYELFFASYISLARVRAHLERGPLALVRVRAHFSTVFFRSHAQQWNILRFRRPGTGGRARGARVFREAAPKSLRLAGTFFPEASRSGLRKMVPAGTFCRRLFGGRSGKPPEMVPAGTSWGDRGHLFRIRAILPESAYLFTFSLKEGIG